MVKTAKDTVEDGGQGQINLFSCLYSSAESLSASGDESLLDTP